MLWEVVELDTRDRVRRIIRQYIDPRKAKSFCDYANRAWDGYYEVREV